jgi:AcrR family transcriptional regulator
MEGGMGMMAADCREPAPIPPGKGFARRAEAGPANSLMPESASMVAKKPRRTAERILEVTLDLFNRFGEPNVSTTLISAELNISPGNLYYHYPAKDELINALFGDYERELGPLLAAADHIRNVEDAWLFLHMLIELIWKHRFLYRDLNDLLSKNRKLETHFQEVLARKGQAMRALLAGLQQGGVLKLDPREAPPLAEAMVVLQSYWLSYEYVRDPRHALEPERAGAALMRGAFHVLSLLLPYLEPASREHLFALAEKYR